MNIVWFILAGVVFAIIYCYFLSLLLFKVGRAIVKKLKEKTMDKTKNWNFSWPVIVVGLLVVQFLVQCYLANLPDTPFNSKLFDVILLLYMVFATLVVVGKNEHDSYGKSQERSRQDAEKQRLVERINELEKAIDKLASERKPKNELKAAPGSSTSRGGSRNGNSEILRRCPSNYVA
jgi:mannose/fructose/N-acetylgalactosamine-specific phosphotransferase system component IID